jgi:hypothetical protein
MIYIILLKEDIISIYKDLLDNIIDNTKGRKTSLYLLFKRLIT